MQLMLVGSISIMDRKGKYSDQDISRRTHSASSETSLNKGEGYIPRNVEYFAFILSSEVLQHRLIGQ